MEAFGEREHAPPWGVHLRDETSGAIDGQHRRSCGLLAQFIEQPHARDAADKRMPDAIFGEDPARSR